MKIQFGDLKFASVLDQPGLVAKPVLNVVEHWTGPTPAENILVTEIDPQFSDSQACCAKYNFPQEEGANCLIIKAKRGSIVKYAACLIPINTRANLNSVVRRFLNVRHVSLAPKEYAVSASGMEYGSITIIGLPADWQLLIDPSLVHLPNVLIGGGLRRSKLLIPGHSLTELPNAVILNNLTIPN